jgi:hypothetical protein
MLNWKVSLATAGKPHTLPNVMGPHHGGYWNASRRLAGIGRFRHRSPVILWTHTRAAFALGFRPGMLLSG